MYGCSIVSHLAIILLLPLSRGWWRTKRDFCSTFLLLSLLPHPVLFVTAFIETSSPVSAWLSSYLSSLPKILTSKEVGVEVVKDVDAEIEANEQAPKEFDPYSGRQMTASAVDQNRESISYSNISEVGYLS